MHLQTSRLAFCFSIVLGILTIETFGNHDQYLKAFATGEKRKACSKMARPKQPPNRVNTTSKLIQLRKVMLDETIINNQAIDAYLITSTDEHQSEYVDPYDRRLKYISGFSGSFGFAIVTKSKAALWTDGRYHVQADEQINCDWLLMRMGYSMVPTMGQWLKSELKPNARIGADPKLVSAQLWGLLELELDESKIEMVEVDVNVVDVIWKGHQEEFKDRPVYIWDVHHAGLGWKEKVTKVREKIKEEGANAMVITALDEIAWMLNIRGRDVPYSPFVRSYVLLTEKSIHMYVNKTKLIKNNVMGYLDGEGSFAVQLSDYESVWKEVKTLRQTFRKVLLPSQCVFSPGVSRKMYMVFNETQRLPKASPIIFLKALKNKIERKGMLKAHIRDAAAMCEFLAYFESRMNAGDEWDELKVANEINKIRYEQANCSGESFPTVVAYGENGGQPHYEPSKTTNRRILFNSTLVLDSGGQYYEGTTDVTRTIHLGEPTQEMKDAYTRVLIGNINYANLTFPSNITPSLTDIVARASLWEAGLDYLHGTGHGIGIFSLSHESPISIAYQSTEDIPLREGYFLTNEPGYYNLFGVRLENVLEVVSKPWLQQLDSGEQFLGFNVITLVPYEAKLIDVSLLSSRQIKWLNDYNAKIRTLVGHELKLRNKTEAFYWMMQKTEYISRTNRKEFYSYLLIIPILIIPFDRLLIIL